MSRNQGNSLEGRNTFRKTDRDVARPKSNQLDEESDTLPRSQDSDSRGEVQRREIDLPGQSVGGRIIRRVTKGWNRGRTKISER